ncbi:MAG: hypothetical protein J7M14_03080, partial [Planctomycetes bacterium]|nr:hypothetical protein [Planctomycetota bacterium]
MVRHGLMGLAILAVVYAASGRAEAVYRSHAFIWDSTNGMQSLGTLGGDTSAAYGVDQNGTVVGSACDAQGDRYAFVWDDGGG